MSEPIIDLKEVAIFQGENRVLNKVSLQVKPGEFIYVIGKVGSGKSSLLKILYADLSLKEGEGSIAGFQLNKLRHKEVPFLRRKVGIVFQDFQLLTDRSVYANLEFVLKATGWKQESAIKNRINEVLDEVNMRLMKQKMPHELSGGEQQRVVIARALLNNPDIILADEPTGNLDPETSESLMKLLKKINAEGKTILMVTHDYPLIQQFPARTLICEGGELKNVEKEKQDKIVDFESLLE